MGPVQRRGRPAGEGVLGTRHELDGGRYIGTGSSDITRDPDTGWINLGTYRVQAHDRNTATIYISPGKHGDIIRRKYWAQGRACPVAVVCGSEPMLWTAGPINLPVGSGEYEYVGGFRNEGVKVVRGKTTTLPSVLSDRMRLHPGDAALRADAAGPGEGPQAIEGGLGDAVGDGATGATKPRCGGDVYDRSFAARLHMRRDRSRRLKRAQRIDREDAYEILG